MGPSFAESAVRRRSLWLFGALCASVVALVAVRPHHHHHHHQATRQFHRFDHYRPVKTCVDGRWVIAHAAQ